MAWMKQPLTQAQETIKTWFQSLTDNTGATKPTLEDVWHSRVPLFYFGKNGYDGFTVDDSYRHVFVTGASGSGKTTGSLSHFAYTYLLAGYGALVLCAKPEEADSWREYCAQTGREADLIVVSLEGDMPYRFNFLDYELRRRDGRGAGSVNSLLQLFSTIMDIIENNTREALSLDFWDRTALDCIGAAITVLSLCDTPLTIQNIKRFIAAAPGKGDLDDPRWQTVSFAGQRLQEAYRNVKTERERGDLKATYDYLKDDYAQLNDRTKSSIQITVSSLTSRFLKGDLREMTCTDSTIDPSMLWKEGKIIVLDIPTIEYNWEGIIIQGIIKYVFQKALQRRSLKDFPRPVMLFMDEYQHFMSSYDYKFLSEARSAGVACVLATQNISNMYSILGGGARDQANSLLGNAATKIFHSNTDITTNEWASSVIGQEWMHMVSTSTKRDGNSSGATMSRQIHARKLPSDFMGLKTGGTRHNFEVEGYVVMTGKGRWRSTGNVWHKARFRQVLGDM